jgi:hypothetical protein
VSSHTDSSFHAHQRDKLKQLVYRMAHRTLDTLLLLLAGMIYRETPKQYSVVRVQKNYSSLLFLYEKSGNVLPAGSAASIPTHECGGLSPRFGKKRGQTQRWNSADGPEARAFPCVNSVSGILQVTRARLQRQCIEMRFSATRGGGIWLAKT